MAEKISLPIEEEYEDKVHPLRPDIKWLWLMVFTVLCIVGIVYAISFGVGKIIIANLSIEKEQELFWQILVEPWMELFDTGTLTHSFSWFTNIDIYVKDSPEINAYAALWANIFLTTGLLEHIKYEEELLFILWHEYGHIKNRDVLHSLSQEIPVIMTLQALGINVWPENFSALDISQKYLSRNKERAADDSWIAFAKKLWLNLECSANFFKKEDSFFEEIWKYLSTHPGDDDRYKKLIESNNFPEKECHEFTYSWGN